MENEELRAEVAMEAPVQEETTSQARLTKFEAERIRVEYFKGLGIDAHSFDKSLKDFDKHLKEKGEYTQFDEHWGLINYFTNKELAYYVMMKQSQLMEGVQIMKQLKERVVYLQGELDRIEEAKPKIILPGQ